MQLPALQKYFDRGADEQAEENERVGIFLSQVGRECFNTVHGIYGHVLQIKWKRYTYNKKITGREMHSGSAG